MTYHTDKSKKWEIALLLAGENKKERERSKLAIDLYHDGRIGNVFVTGGPGAENLDWKEDFSLDGFKQETEAEKIANYVNLRGIPQSKIYTDGRSVDTLGNFAVPFASPLKGNPKLEDIDELLLITEENHMLRTLDYAKKVISSRKIWPWSSKGDYNPGLVVSVYNSAILRRLKSLPDANPEKALDFLIEKHPFYQEGWFTKKSSLDRKIETGKSIIKWTLDSLDLDL